MADETNDHPPARIIIRQVQLYAVSIDHEPGPGGGRIVSVRAIGADE